MTEHASSPFEKDLPGNCCCCGLPTDLFQFGHYWCSICEGRGHNNELWARELGESHDTSEDCKRLWKNFLEDLTKEGFPKDALKAIAGEVDSCGYSHMSILHDISKVLEFASEVLRGRDPHEVLREMGG